ncbi:hypothetical protein AgCh_036473 [Apium graveolens]
MDSGGKFGGISMVLLKNQSNYRIWRTCMESYLIGKDLWEVVGGERITPPENNEANQTALKEWRKNNAKADDIWNTFNNLFNKNDEARLQMLENELANVTQGWAQQPTLEEFENLLSSQEALEKQMVGVSISNDEGIALLARRQKGSEEKIKEKDSYSHYTSNETGGRIKCYQCEKLGHIKKKFGVRLQPSNMADTKRYHDPISEEDWSKSFMAQTFTTADHIDFKEDWIIDSGSGHHLTGDDSKFLNLCAHKGKESIVTTDNTIHHVEKEGEVVFHVPGLKKNLLSVANAVDAGNYILFRPNDVKFLQNLKELQADVIHTGKYVNALYVLSASTSYVEKLSNCENASLWYERLGHINMNKLKVMVEKKLVDGLPNLKAFGKGEICEGCQYGKAHRLPFEKKSVSRCKTPLERVHSDLFGPTRTSSYSDFRYMLLFVDDYTRFTWVYFVKQKSEVFQKFLEFKETAEGHDEACNQEPESSVLPSISGLNEHHEEHQMEHGERGSLSSNISEEQVEKES